MNNFREQEFAFKIKCLAIELSEVMIRVQINNLANLFFGPFAKNGEQNLFRKMIGIGAEG